MMTDDRDPLLQTLFEEAGHDLDGGAFTARVVAQTRILRYRAVVGLSSVALMLAVGAWFFAVPVEIAQLITQVLTISLIDLGDSWIAWLLSPINNIASLVVLSVKSIRVARKKITGASYAN
ncbi:MAG: hypothetical protein QF828_02225 [Pseudomonadales bacterium]|jgi:hypothetical protein|nr:hypothetical protein [Pseudomonadales bacterium]|tara:strand:- start:325 stop:687 length:363 start_codon:yes stop_codon:yes gene_type:complete